MGLFSRNPNETAFAGGRKNWAEVIKNTGPANALIWRQPEEDFNSNTTLIVMPGEEAIFVRGGNIEQVFDSGTYQLSTDNYPFISRIRNALTGGISSFNCVVYYFRKAHSPEIKWGTTSPIQVYDKSMTTRRDNMGVLTNIRGRGSYRVAINNPTIFLQKMIGSNVRANNQQELFDSYFHGEFQSKIKSSISAVLNRHTGPMVGLQEKFGDLAKIIEPTLNETFDDYGMEVIRFSIAALDIEDTPERRRYEEARIAAAEAERQSLAAADRVEDMATADARAKLLLAQGTRAELDTLGTDWDKVQSKGILKDLANNNSGVAAVGAGLGMAMTAGNVFAGMAQGIAPVAPPPTPAVPDIAERLKKLNHLLEAGLITQAVYDQKQAEILSEI